MNLPVLQDLDQPESQSFQPPLENEHCSVEKLEVIFFRSNSYLKVLADLQNQFEDKAQEVQLLLEATGREAIRTTIQQLTVKAQTETLPQPSPIEATEAQEETPPPQADNQADNVLAVNAQSHSSAPMASKWQGRRGKNSALTAAELTAQREDYLRQVGQLLSERRRSQGMSLEKLHETTRISMHYLKALETGQVGKLPEVIYVRGFIRLIARALGLDGDRLVTDLPMPNPNEGVLPSWQPAARPSPSKMYLNPVHLYLGYATLMAGAVGGLNYLQSSHRLGLVPQSPAPEQPDSQAVHHKGGRCQLEQNAQGPRAMAGQGIAPPEMLSVHAF
ncbi:hypothetical protein BST81_05075 [Leptolyngbya sp. 'hensonii']|uniref:helix-turn-helix domain-containing protein n=1 Tax=Leptolyngbya sp. 'hensonii' TaxID=1922337 RepID=UPI0009503108|nr:helix-turn-helix transcriptional regulator [Leptolyngbya sp. 'hensonii']OLP19500.1 hypothetical protein BST81_05075 [Leptolyngbya sp. 'hensonii']